MNPQPSTALPGKVRVLPPDTSGAPAHVPFTVYDGYLGSLYCGEHIDTKHVPDSELLTGVINRRVHLYAYCTRQPHDSDTPHTCHLRNTQQALDPSTNPVVALIVWDSE